MPKMVLVSIILCTRNRAAKLRRTLQSIQALEQPRDADYELIVVDNGSTDETADVCASLEPELGGRLRRIFVEEPGKSRAANAGFEVARGEIIAFLDDDVLPQRDWLAVVCREFSAAPTLGAISGRVELFNPADLPTSIRRQTERIEFQSVDDAFNLFTGCNVAVRRGLIERLGLFDPALGPGSRVGIAEDSDFFYRAWKAGGKLVYVPSLFVHHDHGRRTENDKVKLARGYIMGRGAFYAKHILRGDLTVARAMYWEIGGALRALRQGRHDLGWKHIGWLLQGFLHYPIHRTLAAARNLFRKPARES